jgi:hypothetical protein
MKIIRLYEFFEEEDEEDIVYPLRDPYYQIRMVNHQNGGYIVINPDMFFEQNIENLEIPDEEWELLYDDMPPFNNMDLENVKRYYSFIQKYQKGDLYIVKITEEFVK